ncbi:MAG: cytochrome c maturation protein CcmE [Actinomycetota bacterium]|nr:cytochrome c maturation protein CcmE [Actinomycetota bacterium]
MSATARFALAASIVVAAIGGLIVWSLSGSTAYYRTPAEIAAEPVRPTQTIRVAGKVVSGSVSQSGDTTAFAIADAGAAVNVTTQDILPDTFRDGVEVVAEGNLTGAKLLTASNVLVKCPSKFEAKLASEGR